jgi:hypothetical protein
MRSFQTSNPMGGMGGMGGMGMRDFGGDLDRMGR